MPAKTLKRLNAFSTALGVEPRLVLRNLAALPWFLHSYREFKAAHRAAGAPFALGPLLPCLGDRHGESGVASGQYFHQDLLVARRVFERQPRRHADVGSRIDGFVAHVAVFREIEVFDIRPAPGAIANVVFRRMDLTGPCDPALAAAFDSVSCLHALEHFGLGRYGDKLDYFGFEKGLAGLARLLCAGGTLYLSLPMGEQRIEFNAHRIFSTHYLLDVLGGAGEFRIERFSYVDDRGDLHADVTPSRREVEENCGCRSGLAILEMVRM